MNSKLRDILTKLENSVEASTVARMNGRTVNNRKIHAEAEKAIRKAVAEDMLELVDSTMVMNRPVDARFAGGESEVRIKLRQKIKEWAAHQGDI